MSTASTSSQSVDEPTHALHVWPCSAYLTQYLVNHAAHYIHGKRIIELGAGGTAVVSLAALKAGAREVYITDQPGHTAAVDLVRENCARNGFDVDADRRIHVVALDWRTPLTHASMTALNVGECDLVVASDCFYDPTVFRACLSTMRSILASTLRAHCGAVFAYEVRCASWSIERDLEELGLICELIDVPTQCHGLCIRADTNLQERLHDRTILLGRISLNK